MPKYANAKIENLPAVLKALETGNHIYHPLQEMVEQATDRVYDTVIRWAPWRTGRTAIAVEKETSREARRPWGRVWVKNMPTAPGSGRREKGTKTRYPFRYPGALEGSKRIQFRYASGPHKGKLTRGWFGKAKGRSGAALKKIYAAADAAIQKAWDRDTNG